MAHVLVGYVLVQPQTVQELSHALIQVWEEDPTGHHPQSNQEYTQTFCQVKKTMLFSVC